MLLFYVFSNKSLISKLKLDSLNGYDCHMINYDNDALKIATTG